MMKDGRKKSGFLGQKMVIIPNNIRAQIKENPITNSLFLTDVGYYPHAEHHYRERQNGAQEYILIYCLEGHGNITVESKVHELEPNSYFLIPPNTAHKYKAQEHNPWSIYWVHFTGITAQSFYQKYNNQNNFNGKKSEVIQIPFEERRIKYFNGIISLLESGYSRDIIEYVNISLWQLLASFTYKDFFSNIRHQNNETDIVDTAITYMKENIDRSLSVEELAEHINYSQSYLYSLFKDETGYPPIHYFNHLKIQKACQYLSFTDMSVKEISYRF